MKQGVTRREFLKVAGAGVAGASLLGTSVARVGLQYLSSEWGVEDERHTDHTG